MQVVYQLRANTVFIGHVQRATLTTAEFGFEQTHGLFGSDQWWARIAAGELPVQTLAGVITRIYMGSMGDWPMFSIRSDAGDESSWTRESNTPEQAALYAAGKRVEIDYVIQRYRPGSWFRGGESRCVVEIRVGET